MMAALFVLVSHSYPLSLGPSEKEPLFSIFGFTLGGVGVITFFVISGYFISLSWARSSGLVDFFCARFLRIYPGLVVVLCVTAFVIGPLYTEVSVKEYFSSETTYGYITNNLWLKNIQFGLLDVFEDNVYPGVNGSLWTLYYEVVLYGLVAVLGYFSIVGNARRFLWFLFVYTVVYILFKFFVLNSEAAAGLFRTKSLHTWSLPFVVGMSFFQFWSSMRHKLAIVIVLVLLCCLFYGSNWFLEAFIIAWCFVVFLVGFATSKVSRFYNRLGDYSFGVYIYAFPIQQIIAHHFPLVQPVQMITLAFPLSLLAALVSWHLIEKPCMRYRGGLANLLKAPRAVLKKRRL